MSDDDVSSRLADIRRRREDVPTRAEIQAAIDAAREDDWTVARIARALGMQRTQLYRDYAVQTPSRKKIKP